MSVKCLNTLETDDKNMAVIAAENGVNGSHNFEKVDMPRELRRQYADSEANGSCRVKKNEREGRTKLCAWLLAILALLLGLALAGVLIYFLEFDEARKTPALKATSEGRSLTSEPFKEDELIASTTAVPQNTTTGSEVRGLPTGVSKGGLRVLRPPKPTPVTKSTDTTTPNERPTGSDEANVTTPAEPELTSE